MKILALKFVLFILVKVVKIWLRILKIQIMWGKILNRTTFDNLYQFIHGLCSTYTLLLNTWLAISYLSTSRRSLLPLGVPSKSIFFKVLLINLQNDQTTTKLHFINLSTCIKKNIIKSICSIRSIKLVKHYCNYSVWSLNSYLVKKLEYLL